MNPQQTYNPKNPKRDIAFRDSVCTHNGSPHVSPHVSPTHEPSTHNPSLITAVSSWMVSSSVFSALSVISMLSMLSMLFMLGCDSGANDVSSEENVPVIAREAPATPPGQLVIQDGWYGYLPRGFPTPQVPMSNPMTPEKVELGRHLFYDERLSANQTQSCASCHHPERAFADAETLPTGSTGDGLTRHSMALVNVAYNSVYTWSNPALAELERQILVPLLAEFPVELGLTGHEEELFARLRADARYLELFTAAFPEMRDPISMDPIVDALASFVRTLVSGHSNFDQFTYQGRATLSESAIRGMELFFSERLECHHCHGGFNFSFSTTHQSSEIIEITYHNTGLYNLDGEGAYPVSASGLFEVSGDPQDMGKFRAPTLRNIAVTAPYMHDGSVATLEEVIRIYEAGGRLIEEGARAGDGRANPYKSDFVSGFTLTDQERVDLITFLESLTDEGFLREPAFADPWSERP